MTHLSQSTNTQLSQRTSSKPAKVDLTMAAQDPRQRSPRSLPSISSLTHGLNSHRSSTASSSLLSERHMSGTGSQRFSTTSYQSSIRGPPRDSGYSNTTWYDSGLSNGSKHTSILTTNNLPVSNLLNPDDVSPKSPLGNSPTTPPTTRQTNQTLPSIDQGFETNFQQPNTDSQNPIDSRRSSVDSRVHNGFHSLAINYAGSPYQKQNQSQTSLNSSLRHSIGPRPSSPSDSRHSSRSQAATRVAPPIQPNPRTQGAPNPTASNPTQGFPWAFPDASLHDQTFSPKRAMDSESPNNHPMSRQNSIAASSVRSSVFSLETRDHLPHGQRRFEDGMAFQKIIGTDVKLGDQSPHGPPMMPHDNASMMNAGNYSRTPELRVSHKLAERKRRSEMKDLFEELNRYVPNNGGAKSSKWEILTKAIDYIKSNQQQAAAVQNEMNRLRSSVEYAHDAHKEIESLRQEMSAMYERLVRLEPSGPHVYGRLTSQMAQQQSRRESATQSRNSSGPQYAYSSGPSAMQGVEFAERQMT